MAREASDEFWETVFEKSIDFLVQFEQLFPAPPKKRWQTRIYQNLNSIDFTALTSASAAYLMIFSPLFLSVESAANRFKTEHWMSFFFVAISRRTTPPQEMRRIRKERIRSLDYSYFL